MPYTAHWTPPPFCRVRLYRNMVSYFVARATRRTLNRLRLSLAPTSVARLAMISPWGLAPKQSINPRGFCRRQFFSHTAEQSASALTASESGETRLSPADEILELSPTSRHSRLRTDGERLASGYRAESRCFLASRPWSPGVWPGRPDASAAGLQRDGPPSGPSVGDTRRWAIGASRRLLERAGGKTRPRQASRHHRHGSVTVRKCEVSTRLRPRIGRGRRRRRRRWRRIKINKIL